jgi:hypothetical protein
MQKACWGRCSPIAVRRVRARRAADQFLRNTLPTVLEERGFRLCPVLFFAAFQPRLRVIHGRPHRFGDALRLSGPCKPAT